MAYNSAGGMIVDGGGAGDGGGAVYDSGPARLVSRTPPVVRSLQGDPRLILGPDGSTLQFVGGQPLMDRGLENLVLISLFTSPGWCGNSLMKTPVGSDFESACNQPITRQSLNEIRNAAERALKSKAFGRVVVEVLNPQGHRLDVRIRINPPGSNPQDLALMKSGGNWQYQAHDPAYQKVRG